MQNTANIVRPTRPHTVAQTRMTDTTDKQVTQLFMNVEKSLVEMQQVSNDMLGKLSLCDKSSAFKAPAQRSVSADQAADEPKGSRQVRQHISMAATK